jgi:hypothetical protein
VFNPKPFKSVYSMRIAKAEFSLLAWYLNF